jgi:REP element-mobilizing transposase RayT
MPRAWRIEYPGALYHVLSRGNERRDIFVGDDDRMLFLDTLAESSDRFEVDICAYVLMSNHSICSCALAGAIFSKPCNGWG